MGDERLDNWVTTTSLIIYRWTYIAEHDSDADQRKFSILQNLKHSSFQEAIF